MTKLEKLRKEYQSYGRWYYHMILDSLGDRNLFNDKNEFIHGMNVVSIAQFLYNVGIIQFDLMRNHGHFIVQATGQQCCKMFDYFRYRFNDRLKKDGYPPLPHDWFFMLRRLETKTELVNAASYSARNSYEARKDILPGGYLWSSNYCMFSEIGELFEYRTVGEVGVRGMYRILGSQVKLPSSYKVSKWGYILPESYLIKSQDGKETKAESLYKDSKDYTYRIFRDYGTYRKVASDLRDTWIPSGNDLESLLQDLLNMKYGVKDARALGSDKICDLAVTLATRYGLSNDEIAYRLNLSPSMVSRLVYSYGKKNHVATP